MQKNECLETRPFLIFASHSGSKQNPIQPIVDICKVLPKNIEL